MFIYTKTHWHNDKRSYGKDRFGIRTREKKERRKKQREIENDWNLVLIWISQKWVAICRCRRYDAPFNSVWFKITQT